MCVDALQNRPSPEILRMTEPLSPSGHFSTKMLFQPLLFSCTGASVIYADTVADLGYADELGNYAEYSGAPNLQVSCNLT